MSSVKTVDKWFSFFIRARDTIKKNGFCPTCGRHITFETSDCGHFLSRRFMSTRWNERNAYAQCLKCNRFENGNQYEFGLYVESLHGKQAAKSLLIESKKTAKYTKFELNELSKYFREQYKQITK